MCYWGFYAFQLEFHGTNFFKELNYINSIFFVVNILSMIVVFRHHRLTVSYEMNGENTVEKVTAWVDETKKEEVR